MLKRDRLEWLLFESTIVDIDFSKWHQYVQIVFLAVWDQFGNEVFPIYDFKKIYFKKPNKFVFEWDAKHFGSENEGQTRSLNVADARVLKSRAHFEIVINLECNGSIQLSCASCEIMDSVNIAGQVHERNRF